MLFYKQMINIQMVLLINVVGLACAFVASSMKVSSNTRILISNAFLYVSAMSLWWLIVSNDNKIEPKVETPKQEILPKASQRYKEINLSSDEVEVKLSLNEFGIEIDEAKLKRFSKVDVLESGLTQINFLDEKGKFIQWSGTFDNGLASESFNLSPLMDQKGKITNIQIPTNIENKESPKQAIINYKLPPGAVAEELEQNGKLVIGYSSSYWGNFTIVDHFLEKKKEDGSRQALCS